MQIKKGYKPICFVDGQLIVYGRNNLFIWGEGKDKYKHILELPRNGLKIKLSRWRILERILRTEPRAAIFFQDKLYLSFKGIMYKIDIQNKVITDFHLYNCRMNNPLQSALVVIEGVNGFNKQIVYGDYWMNDNGAPVSIYAEKENGWNEVYTFPNNTVRHIHAIVPDKYRDCVWILTGDNDNESGFWMAKNNFKEVKPILVGSQNVRSCAAHVYEKGVLFATDSPNQPNYIGWLFEKNGKWCVEKIKEIEGSCIYSIKTIEGSYFSTVVEFDNDIRPNFLTWFTYKRGKGIKSWNSTVVFIKKTDNGMKIIEEKENYKKDYWPMRLCRYAAVQFCYDYKTNRLIVHFVAIKDYDGCWCEWNKRLK